MIRTISEQARACASVDASFVGILLTTGENWTWYVAATFSNARAAESWFDAQPNTARVYRKSELYFSK